jgi:hypothetical protein
MTDESAELTPELEAQVLQLLVETFDIPPDRARQHLERFRLLQREERLLGQAEQMDPRMLARALAVLAEQESTLKTNGDDGPR